jgi:N-acetylglutamate synthase-like GNAT family acetyltransferase
LPEVLLADILIRPALQTDFPAIRALIRETGINPMSLDWRRFIVAELPGTGFAGCGQLKPHGDGSLELASIAVIPGARGKGLARLIIQRLMADATRPLYLTCRDELGSFYEKFGFQPVQDGEMPRYFKRISRMAGVISALRLIKVRLLVMVLK